MTVRVVAVHAQPLSRLAQLWAASLHFQPCALAGSSALEILGLPMPNDGRIHVIGPRQGRVPPMTSCVLHTAVCHETAAQNPDCVGVATAVLQALRWATSDAQAIFHATWAIQRGLVRMEDLQALARDIKTSPGSERMRRRLNYLRPGVDSLGEHYFDVECRKRGLPEPVRQRVRLDSNGCSRYMDAEFRVAGRSLVVEVDGLHHLQTNVHHDDQWRANEVALQGVPVLRVPVTALRMDPDPFFEQLGRGLSLLRAGAA